MKKFTSVSACAAAIAAQGARSEGVNLSTARPDLATALLAVRLCTAPPRSRRNLHTLSDDLRLAPRRVDADVPAGASLSVQFAARIAMRDAARKQFAIAATR